MEGVKDIDETFLKLPVARVQWRALIIRQAKRDNVKAKKDHYQEYIRQFIHTGSGNRYEPRC